MKNKIAFVFIATALCVTNFYMAKSAVINSPPKILEYKVRTFTVIQQGGMQLYKSKIETPYKSRLFSIAAGNVFVFRFGKIRELSVDRFSAAVAAYDTVGFALLFIVMLLFFKNSLLCIFAYAACSAYRWTPAAELLIFPWDTPMPFIWAGILVLSQSRYRKWLPAAAGLAMGFKETIILAALIPLFDKTICRHDRFNRFIITGFVCVAVKIIIDIAVGNPVPLATMLTHYPTTCRTGEYWLIHRNINTLMRINLNHVIFSAGGLIVAAFLLPVSKMSRRIVLAYIPFMFAFCVITEARLWNEVIPVILYGLKWRTE